MADSLDTGVPPPHPCADELSCFINDVVCLINRSGPLRSFYCRRASSGCNFYLGWDQRGTASGHNINSTASHCCREHYHHHRRTRCPRGTVKGNFPRQAGRLDRVCMQHKKGTGGRKCRPPVLPPRRPSDCKPDPRQGGDERLEQCRARHSHPAKRYIRGLGRYQCCQRGQHSADIHLYFWTSQRWHALCWCLVGARVGARLVLGCFMT